MRCTLTHNAYRRVITIRAEDSPNVQRGLRMREQGLNPDGATVVPGVLGWEEYLFRRQNWDRIRQTVGLDARFYEGAELLMFPPDWIDHGHMLARNMHGKPRKAKAMGGDPGEGKSKTSFAVVDEYGLIDLISTKTPDTSVQEAMILGIAHDFGLSGEQCGLDRGGGGKQVADRLRAFHNFKCRTIAFGETVMMEPKRGLRLVEERMDNREERYVYFNRRSQMYDQLRLHLCPTVGRVVGGHGEKVQEICGFAIPERFTVLRQELAPIPLTRDREGRLKLLPKHKPEGSTERCLVDLIGWSPDEADALVVAVHVMTTESNQAVAGAF